MNQKEFEEKVEEYAKERIHCKIASEQVTLGESQSPEIKYSFIQPGGSRFL